jgi:glutamate--cysteine ligase
MLDTAYGGTRHTNAMRLLRQRIDNPDLTPSAQVLEAAQAHGGFFRYSMFASGHHKQALLANPLDAPAQARFEAAARESLLAQQQVEADDTGSFEDFVAAYYA